MSDSKSDYHAVLGLAKDATAREARAAYRRLAKRFHPDAPGGDKERFYAIAEAHTAFCQAANVEARRVRHSLVNGFWSIARASPPSVTMPKNGEDREAVLYLSLEDALKGATRRVTLASGRALDVRCPPGCSTNDVIRLKGAGHRGQDGGKNGDALIRIKILAHQRAILKDRDLHMLLWLDHEQLRSGGKVEVSTPHGPLKVTIPPLCSHGQSLRLKGLGLPACRNKAAGHLVFTLKSRRTSNFADALSRFSRIWANPLRHPLQTKT